MFQSSMKPGMGKKGGQPEMQDGVRPPMSGMNQMQPGMGRKGGQPEMQGQPKPPGPGMGGRKGGMPQGPGMAPMNPGMSRQRMHQMMPLFNNRPR